MMYAPGTASLTEGDDASDNQPEHCGPAVAGTAMNTARTARAAVRCLPPVLALVLAACESPTAANGSLALA